MTDEPDDKRPAAAMLAQVLGTVVIGIAKHCDDGELAEMGAMMERAALMLAYDLKMRRQWRREEAEAEAAAPAPAPRKRAYRKRGRTAANGEAPAPPAPESEAPLFAESHGQ